MEFKHKSFKEMCKSFAEKLSLQTSLIDFKVPFPTIIDAQLPEGGYRILDADCLGNGVAFATLDNGMQVSGNFSKSDVGKMVMISDKGTFEIKSIVIDHLEEEMKYYEHLATQSFKMTGISTKTEPEYRPIRFKEAQARRKRKAPW